MIAQTSENLALGGWCFEPCPRRTLAKLRQPDGEHICIDVKRLVSLPEYMVLLSEAEQNEVREMALQAVA